LCALLVGSAWAVEPDRSPAWAALTAPQQQALAPLRRDWPSIDLPHQQKWLEVASRFPTMAADERGRVQERMADWARMTPNERASARLQFQEVRRLPADERQARWQAYQALTQEERSTLAQRAKPAATAKAASSPLPRYGTGANVSTAKRNLVPATPAPPASAVAPTVVQAKPGATTTTMGTRASPPPHHQAGMPKIAATPGFVDPTTLLPQRGPQGAAARPVASNGPAAQP
jgi:hypothetical protein